MNKIIKHLISAALIAAAALTAHAAGPIGVALLGADGSRTDTALADIDRVEIGTEGITVHTLGEQHKVAYEDLDRLLIGIETNSVERILPDGGIAVWPTKVTDRLSVAGLADGDIVSVADLSGTVVATAKADAEGHASLFLADSPAGVYVVYVKSFSTKIIKQ